MADISVRGYVSRPQTRTGTKGAYSTFTLSESVKDPKAPNGKRKVFYNVTSFKDGVPPADSSYVKLSGWFKPREYESNGVKRLSLDVVAQEMEVSPPRGDAHEPAPKTAPAAPAASGGTEEDWTF